jgi:hypothetical protein
MASADRVIEIKMIELLELKCRHRRAFAWTAQGRFLQQDERRPGFCSIVEDASLGSGNGVKTPLGT